MRRLKSDFHGPRPGYAIMFLSIVTSLVFGWIEVSQSIVRFVGSKLRYDIRTNKLNFHKLFILK